jgi:hypothetical protein
LGEVLGMVGVAVVSADGVTIRYRDEWAALVPCPVTAVPRRVRG